MHVTPPRPPTRPAGASGAARPYRFPAPWGRLAVIAACAGMLAGCGGDKKPGPPEPRGPQLVQVETAAELETAFTTAVAGDTIQILAGLGGSEFRMTHGFVLAATRSPLLLTGDERSPAKPRIIFPDTAIGLRIIGHTRSGDRETTIENMDFQGGRNTIQLENSRATIRSCTFRMPLYEGISANGAGSDGTVELCYFEAPGIYGLSTHSGSRLVARRNTVVLAGDCGFYIDSPATLTANNIVQSQNYGIILQPAGGIAAVDCNNSWQSGSINYTSAIEYDFAGRRNYELNPRFCAPGVYTIQSGSPLAAVNSGGCGTIGAFEVGCE